MTLPVVTIVDYGMGNLFSVERAVSRAGGTAVRAVEPQQVLSAERLILPGVGAFGDGMASLTASGLADAVREAVAEGAPLLGICLGMQLLLSESEEYGVHRGLDLIPGRVVRFPEPTSGGVFYKIPHVGWAGIELSGGQPEEWAGTVLEDVIPGAPVYFVHSYFALPESEGDIIAVTDYCDNRFCSAVARGRVQGCQFHPEMSGETGLAIYRRFLLAGL